MGYNKVMIIGNLGSDPEMRFTPNGQPVANFRVAVNRRFKDKDENMVEETEWFSIVTWGKLAGTCNQYLSKGKSVFIEGRLQSREWEDKDGNKRTKVEIVASTVQFLSPKDDAAIEVDAGGTIDEAAEAIQTAVEIAKVPLVKTQPENKYKTAYRKIAKEV